jgi:hypothetical protein
MSPLWSDMALARAAWAKADELESALEGRRPVRRVHHSWLSSSFAL